MENPLKAISSRIALVLLSSLPLAVNAQNKANPVNPYQLQTAGQADYKLVTSQSRLRVKALPQQTLPTPLAAKPFAAEIESAARASDLDPILVHALIHVESRHQSDALSNKGAIGLMQVLPSTARRFGINQPEKPAQNLLAGTRHLRNLLDLFNQRVDLALAAYNAGEGAVMKYRGEIPPYPETQHYVPAVLEKYEEWRPGKRRAPIQYMAGTLLNRKALKNPPASTTDNEPWIPPPRPQIDDGAEAPSIKAEPELATLPPTPPSPDNPNCFEPCPDWQQLQQIR